MDSGKDEVRLVYEKLCEIGCCKMCTIRFLGETERHAYFEAQKTLLKIGIEENENGACKIQKSNPCIACLGLLEKNVVADTINKVCEEITKEGYDSKSFNIAMTLPISFQIRAHAIWIYLKKTFPNFCSALFPLELVSVNVKDVWKWIIGRRIEDAISKRFVAVSDFVVTISFDYEDDDSEVEALTAMGYKAPKGSRKQKYSLLYSRKGVDNFLSTVREETFKDHCSVPPSIPSHSVQCDSVSLLQNSIYFAGRYNKFDRHLPQTPWIIDGERRIESSIQELISDPLMELAKSQTPKFSASGREDVDVRTLGRGRPFSVEFIDPRRTEFSFQELRNVETKINSEAHDKVAIRDLQLVEKESLKALKEGEEHKRKRYCAYCIVFGPLPIEALEKLSSLAPVTLQQKTPIRVLHRRPFAVRPRIIHSMKAIPHSSDSDGRSYFKLCVETQAGTYVKEFVHGDFGRTIPNVGDLLGGIKVDILALDVEDVSIDWPPQVKYGD